MKNCGDAAMRARTLVVASPHRDLNQILALPSLLWKQFLHDVNTGGIEQIRVVTADIGQVAAVDGTDVAQGPTRPPSAEPKSACKERFAAQSCDAFRDSGNPVYDRAREFTDIFPEKIPTELCVDCGKRHEIDLGFSTNYRVTRQWPLPRDQLQKISISHLAKEQKRRGLVISILQNWLTLNVSLKELHQTLKFTKIHLPQIALT